MRIFLLILCLVGFINLSSQDRVSGNLWLQVLDFENSDKPISILVKGNLEEIENYLPVINGTFKYSFRGYHSVVLPEKDLKLFLNQKFVSHFIFNGGKGEPLINVSKKNTKANQAIIYKGESWGTYTGKNVVLGIIDSGIDIGQPDFQDKNGKTRILKIWDQTRNLDTTLRPSFGYGEVYDSANINSGTCPHKDPNRYSGHGTMVSGIAAGNGNSVPDTVADYRGYASESPIVFVATDFSANNWSQTVAEAVDWIYQEADRLNLPCVINISAGGYLGSHDGFDFASQFIDSLVSTKSGRAFVCAAGNSGNVPNYHIKTRVKNDTSFTWFKPNTSSSLVFIEAWADTSDFKNLIFSFGKTDTSTWKDSTFFNDVIANRLDTLMSMSLGGGAQLMTWAERQGPNYLFQILLQKPLNTAYYKFLVSGSGGYDCWNASWLGMSDIVNSNLPSSSVYPNISKYQKPDSLQSVVSGWNCHPNLISVGNYNNRLEYENVDGNRRKTVDLPVGGIGKTSSRGPNRRGVLKPDIAAPGNFTVTSGRLVDVQYLASTPSKRYKLAKGGFHFSNGGTSMASPVVAGLAALYFEKCPNGTQADFKKALLKTSFSDSLTGTVPNFSFGSGKVDAKAMLEFTHIYDTIISSTGDFDFCENDSLALSLKSGGMYFSLKWSSGDTTNQVLINDSNYSTPWKVSFMDKKGCKGYTDTVLIEQNLLPNVRLEGDSIFCLEDGDTLKAITTDSNNNWLWSSGDTSQLIAITDSGKYWVRATSPKGCFVSDTQSIKGVLCYVSVEELNKNSLVKVYPNPFKDELFVEFENEGEIVNYELLNQFGSVLQNGNLDNSPKIKIKHLPPGIYFLKVKTKTSKYHIKVLKQ